MNEHDTGVGVVDPGTYAEEMRTYDGFFRGDWRWTLDHPMPTGPATPPGKPAPSGITAEQLRLADEISRLMASAAATFGHPGYDRDWSPMLHDVSLRAHVALEEVRGWCHAAFTAAGVERPVRA